MVDWMLLPLLRGPEGLQNPVAQEEARFSCLISKASTVHENSDESRGRRQLGGRGAMNLIKIPFAKKRKQNNTTETIRAARSCISVLAMV
jgi:hypothetical protein